MEEEEDLDKETVGRKVSTSNIGLIYIIQNFYITNVSIIYISTILTFCNEMPKLLVLIQKLVIGGFSSQVAGRIRLHQKLEIKGKSVFILQHVSVSLVPLSSIKWMI